MTTAEHAQVDIVRMKYTAAVLKAAVMEQAKDGLISEQDCLDLAAAYFEAAETARERRMSAGSYRATDRNHMSIAGHDSPGPSFGE